jgi:hypothetical protein
MEKALHYLRVPFCEEEVVRKDKKSEEGLVFEAKLTVQPVYEWQASARRVRTP